MIYCIEYNKDKTDVENVKLYMNGVFKTSETFLELKKNYKSGIYSLLKYKQYLDYNSIGKKEPSSIDVSSFGLIAEYSENRTISESVNTNNIKGIEIDSKQTGLGNSLTNVHYANNGKSEFDINPTDKSLKLTQEAKEKWGKSVEAWYKSNNAQSKGIPEGIEGDKFDMNLMVGLITDKLNQYPNLIEQINRNGGLVFLEKSTHNMGNGRWSSKNPKNMFMKSLIQAYKNVNTKYGLESEKPNLTANQIYNQLGDKTQSENVVIDEVNGRKPAVESKENQLTIVDKLKQFTNKYNLPFDWKQFQVNIFTPLEIFNRFFQEGLQFAQNEEQEKQIYPKYYGLEGKGLSVTVKKESSNKWYLSSLYLPKFMQSKGIGKDIVDILKYIASTSKSDKTIYIWSEKEAVRFWEKQGFKKTGEQITNSDQHLFDNTLPPFEVMEITIKGNQPKEQQSIKPIVTEQSNVTNNLSSKIKDLANNEKKKLETLKSITPTTSRNLMSNILKDTRFEKETNFNNFKEEFFNYTKSVDTSTNDDELNRIYNAIMIAFNTNDSNYIESIINCL